MLTVDIAGVPGTGKTATVHAVVKELKRKGEDGVRTDEFLADGRNCRLSLMLRSMD